MVWKSCKVCKENRYIIKFLNLQKINAQYTTELKQAAAEVIDSDRYLLANEVKSV